MLKIMLVDDDPLQAFLRKAILEKRFSDVVRVTGAAEALCQVEQAQFARSLGLVITGHQLGGIGGPAFVAELQSRMPPLPVLVLGDSMEEASNYSGDHVYFLPRPILPEELLSVATQMLAQDERKTA